MSMFKPLQARTLRVSGAALPTYGADGVPILTPVSLIGTETQGELFAYTLELKTPDSLAFSPSLAANIDLNELVGTEITVFIELEGTGEFIPGLQGDAGMANVGAGVREISAIVADACLVREDGRSIVYSLTLRPWPWRATLNKDCRLFQDMNVIEASDTVLNSYTYPVEKRLFGPAPGMDYPKRDIQRQHWESDWTFLQRIWEEWGIVYWFEHSGGAHRLVLADGMAAYHEHGEAYRTIRYEAPTGKRIDEEHIHALSVRSSLTTGVVSSIDYDYTRPRADMTTKYEDPRDTAQARQEHYTWGDYAQPQAGATGLAGAPNEPLDEARHLAHVRAQALRCTGLRAKGQGNLRGLTTGQTFMLTQYPQAAANCEYVVISATLKIEVNGEATGAAQSYQCSTEFEIQPVTEEFRLMQRAEKPRVSGQEYAVVVGPEGQEIWTDAYGRVKVQFIWDRLGKSDENAMCWVRVAGQWQGNQFGERWLPRVGNEVMIAFINGDPDLPVVTSGGVANADNMPVWDLPGNQALSGVRSRSLGGSGQSNHIAMDDTNGELQAQLSSDPGASVLSLGMLRRIVGGKGRQDARGKGYELRTDFWGVLRAAMGMLITTEARPGGQSHAKDMGETVARLTQARDLQESLAGLAQQHEAQEQGADQSEVAQALKAQNDGIKGGTPSDENAFPQYEEPHLTIASRAGTQLTTAGSTHIASDENLALTTGAHVGVAVGKSLFMSVSNAFSLFVHQLGIKLIAASGKVRIEAQSDNVEITAKKGVEIMSTTDWINVTAKEGIRLTAGGTQLEISAAGIRGFTNGQFLVHAASHATDGPQGKSSGFPAFPQSGPGQLEVLRHYATSAPVDGSLFKVIDSMGVQHNAALDGAGRALVSNLAPGAVTVLFGKDPHDPWAPSSYQSPPLWQPTDAA
jgi:type VI secretion system secreted protein VgrG